MTKIVHFFENKGKQVVCNILIIKDNSFLWFDEMFPYPILKKHRSFGAFFILSRKDCYVSHPLFLSAGRDHSRLLCRQGACKAPHEGFFLLRYSRHR